MADTYVNLTDLTYYHGRIERIFASQNDVDAIDQRIDDLDIPTKVSDLTNDGDGTSGSKFATESYVDQNGGKIDTIKVNGTTQQITNKAVDISVPTKVSDLTNDSNFQTASDVQSAISSAVSTVLKYKGAVPDLAALEAITTKEVGDVYDVQSSGINYAWSGTAWDPLGFYIDMSDYWAKTELVAIMTAQIDALFA